MITDIIKTKFLQYKIYIIIGALVALIVGGFFTIRNYYLTQCEIKIKTINEKNLKDKNMNLEKIRIIEKNLAVVKDELEKTNVERKKKIADLHTYYTNYITKHGLRDPGRKTNPPAATMPGSTSAAGDTSRSCDDQRLSDQASGFLLDLTREADEMKADYQACYEWAEKVKRTLKPEN